MKKLPHILALHLKRFKYMEQLNRYTKLSYRVVFPLELRLFNTVSLILYLNSYLLTLEAISRACSGHPKGRLSFGSLSLWKILAMIIAEGLLNVASKIKNRPWFV